MLTVSKSIITRVMGIAFIAGLILTTFIVSRNNSARAENLNSAPSHKVVASLSECVWQETEIGWEGLWERAEISKEGDHIFKAF